jgi:hypothetical protein
MSARAYFKRFPTGRRQACVPVTSTRPNATEGSERTGVAVQASGGGVSPGRRASAPVDSIVKRIKE